MYKNILTYTFWAIGKRSYSVSVIIPKGINMEPYNNGIIRPNKSAS